MNIDQEDRYNKLADWAESADRGIHPERGETGTEATRSSRELIRRAGGRPSVDPASEPGAVSPRRQVRLPRALSERVDQLADRENRSASDLMREAIAQYVATHDEQRAGDEKGGKLVKDPDVRATVERALEAGQRREDIDMVVRARYTYEWGGGDALHLELADEVERLRTLVVKP